MGRVSQLPRSKTHVPSCPWLCGLATGGHLVPWPATLTCHCSWNQAASTFPSPGAFTSLPPVPCDLGFLDL